MRRLVIIMTVILSSNFAWTQEPLFYSIRNIDNVAKVTVLNKTLIEKIDTCKNGKIAKYPTEYLYKCHLIENIYGNLLDSIFELKYIEPILQEYNDSCELSLELQPAHTSISGLERKLTAGNDILLFFNTSHIIFAAREKIVGIDSFFISHMEVLKQNQYTFCIDQSDAIGETESFGFCSLKCLYSQGKVSGATVSVYSNGIINRYNLKTPHRMNSIDPRKVWKFKITKRKIIIYDESIRYKMHIT